MIDIILGLWYIWLPIIGILTTAGIMMWMYTIAPANSAHVAVQRGRTRVFSSDKDCSTLKGYSSEGRAAYYKVPNFIPGAGMEVHDMSLEIQPINVPDFKAFDIDRARFLCDIMAYVAIQDPVEAAKRFGGNMKSLTDQVEKVVQAITRDSTTKKTIREIINDREGIIKEIKEPLTKAIANWGLSLKDIELVEFKDAPGTHVISDISSIIEEQIESEARQKNAEQKKIARLKEAEAEEIAKKREIARDEEIGKRQQVKDKLIAEKEKIALAEQLEVTKVQKVKNQEIEKEKARVLAEQEKVVARINAEQKKDVEAIIKEQKKLEGEGDKIRQQQQAIGQAAPIREKGTAEADVIQVTGTAEADIIYKKWNAEAKGKDELAVALSKYGPGEIQALIAELLVDKDKTVGVALAEALAKADMKVFAGNGAKDGFDLGKLVESINVSSPNTANAIIHKLGKPNDIGFEKGFAVGKEHTEKKQRTEKPKETKQEKKQEKYKSAAQRIKDISNGKKPTIKTEDIKVRM